MVSVPSKISSSSLDALKIVLPHESECIVAGSHDELGTLLCIQQMVDLCLLEAVRLWVLFKVVAECLCEVGVLYLLIVLSDKVLSSMARVSRAKSSLLH